MSVGHWDKASGQGVPVVKPAPAPTSPPAKPFLPGLDKVKP